MKPLKLTLNGFSGIWKGMRRETFTLNLADISACKKIVAIVGPNGRGKTTLLENLHPYRLMPSQATTLSPGSFSFWNHLSFPEASKILDWELYGVQYRTEFHFKLRGASKKADYYLFQQDVNSQEWRPAALEDGTISDGKAETYDRCVNELLGPPERFFTSAFAAQKRRKLSDYDASDVKVLLASILNLGVYRSLASKANAVGKFLRNYLEDLQEQLALGRAANDGIAAATAGLISIGEQEAALLSQQEAKDAALSQAKHNLAILESTRESIAKELEEAAFLAKQISNAKVTADTAANKLRADAQKFSTEREHEVSRLGGEETRIATQLRQLEVERGRHQVLLESESLIDRAYADLPGLRLRLVEIDAEVAVEQNKASALVPLRLEHQKLVEQRADLNASGSAKTIYIKSLNEAGALVKQVPCHGTELQRNCSLLAHANEAASQAVKESATVHELREQYVVVNRAVKVLEQQLEGAAAIDQALAALNATRARVVSDIALKIEQSARREMLQVAKQRLPELQVTCEQHRQRLEEIRVRKAVVKAENMAERTKLDRALAQEAIAHKAAVDQLQARLDKLAKPTSPADFEAARKTIHLAGQALEVVQTQLAALSSQKVTMLAKLQVHQEVQENALAIEAEADLLNDEIAKFKLLEKGLGNDGLVALSIDDAGPSISGLCNELLKEVYGPSYAVRLDTQRELLSGDYRETFAITVLDSSDGKSCLLDYMSGGQQVWINECLTKAIALYVGRTSNIRHQTLFTDEVDGPLDPDRKRQFMQMKLAVLKRGAHEREYCISQNPEFWAFADHVIDLADL